MTIIECVLLVQVFLTPRHPIPNVIFFNWQQYHYPEANGWDTPYLERVERLKRIVSPSIAMQEIIDL